MSAPDGPSPAEQPGTGQPTLEQPEVTADANTGRPLSPWRARQIPSHLGRARTSTVVLSLLFLAISALYLQIRPDPARPATDGTGTEQPATATTPAPGTTAPLEETTGPEPSTSLPTPTEQTPTEPTSTPPPTPTDLPTGTTEPTPATPGEGSPATPAPELPTVPGTPSPPG